MASVRKEVSGIAAELRSTYKATPVGGTSKGPGASGPVNTNILLKTARGNYDVTASADTKDYGLTKGPQRQTLGRVGVSLSGNGKGRFGGKVVPDSE